MSLIFLKHFSFVFTCLSFDLRILDFLFVFFSRGLARRPFFFGARSVKRTDKGELSVHVAEWTMLTKALLPLPDKFKGFTDKEKRYRQRHLDLIVNAEVMMKEEGG